MAKSPRTRPAAPRPQTSSTGNGGVPSTDQIAQRAYQLWEASGRPDGKDVEHWYTAERELRSPKS